AASAPPPLPSTTLVRSTARYPEEGPVVEHAELRWPLGGGVMLSGVVGGDSTIKDLPPGTGSLYVVTDEPDLLYERARAAGATMRSEAHTSELQSPDHVE